MNIVKKTLLGIALSGVATLAQAAPINGSFGLTGTFTPLGGTTADTATGIDFTAAVVASCGGSYTSIFGACALFGGDVATLGDIPLGTLPVSGGVAYSDSDWIATATLAFDLTAITSVVRNPANQTSLEIRGTGLARTTVAGFDPTAGTFTVTLNGNNSGNFTFSNSVETFARVPEPGTLALLGLGIVGLGLSRRRKAG